MTPSARRKICIVVASRANYARIKSVLKAVKAHPNLQLQLIVSASALLYRFGSAVDVIRADGFEPDEILHIILEGENPTTMAKSTGIAIMEMATAFANLRPDVVLTVADRFETLATAVAASYMNITLAHTQGGEVTGSIDESVRHAVTKFSHIHFPATDQSAERLIKLGENPDYIFRTGCPAIDLLPEIKGKPLPKQFFDDWHIGGGSGAGATIDPVKPYLVVMQHPVTTEYGSGLDQINETLKAVHGSGMQAVWFWPNVDAGSEDISKGLRVFRENTANHHIRFFRNMPPEEFALLLANCACMVGNSSAGLREAAFLGVPSVNIGNRQNGRERGDNVVDADHDRDQILACIRRQVDHGRYASSHLFGDGHAGARIADVLAECTPPIQKWLTY